jgi:catechol 2,3-dioxygenase-like lactoylglutathione lyase family enzyme
MDNSPLLDQLNLVVSDMQATVTFYRRLGLDIPDTEPAFQVHHRSARLPGGLDLDFDSAEFARHWDAGWQSGRAVLGFKVSSRERVDSLYSIVEDPDGNPVGLMSPVDPERRSPPDFP